jgi:hypothetical protein
VSLATGALTATGTGASVAVEGSFSVAVWRSATGNKTGSVTLERSADQGTTWIPVYLAPIRSAEFLGDSTVMLVDPERAFYRVRAVAVTSGETINYRIAQ